MLLSGQDSDYDLIGYKRDRRRRPRTYREWQQSPEGQNAALFGVANAALSGQARNEPGLEYKPGATQLTPLDTMAGPITDTLPNKPMGPDPTSYNLLLPSGNMVDVRNPTPEANKFAQDIGYGPGGYGSPELTAFTDFAATQDLRHPGYGGVDLRYFEPNLKSATDLPSAAYTEPFEFGPPLPAQRPYSGTGYYAYQAQPGAFAALATPEIASAPVFNPTEAAPQPISGQPATGQPPPDQAAQNAEAQRIAAALAYQQEQARLAEAARLAAEEEERRRQAAATMELGGAL